MASPSESDRLSTPALHVLLALGTGTKHGYAIMRDIADRSGGTLGILPGTLYTAIRKLLEAGLVEEHETPPDVDSSDARRRYYRVTKRGRVAVQEETRRLALLVRLGKVFER